MKSATTHEHELRRMAAEARALAAAAGEEELVSSEVILASSQARKQHGLRCAGPLLPPPLQALLCARAIE